MTRNKLHTYASFGMTQADPNLYRPQPHPEASFPVKAPAEPTDLRSV